MSDVWTIELEKEEPVITAELAQQSGESYTLPMAGPDVLGGVKPAQKTNEMTKRVGIDENGRLWSEKESEQVIEEVIGKYLQNNPIIPEETDPTVPAWAKQPNKPSYTAAEVGALSADTVIPDGGIPIPNTASVGQTIVVKAVDENGRPTEWEATDLPSGSSEWEIIASGELTEEATGIDITVDNDGNPFALAEARLYLLVNGTETNTADRGFLRFRHNSNTAKYGAEVSVRTMIRNTIGVISGAYAMYDYTSNVAQTNGYVGSQHELQTSFCIDKGYEALTAIYILGTTENANTMGIGTKWALKGVRK